MAWVDARGTLQAQTSGDGWSRRAILWHLRGLAFVLSLLLFAWVPYLRRDPHTPADLTFPPYSCLLSVPCAQSTTINWSS